MNDHSPMVLGEFIEQTLAALPLCDARKRAMREEMLAHLLAVYDDEFARSQNEQAAIAATLRRFGESANLTDDLRAGVPWHERVHFLIFGRKGKPMRWFYVILGVVVLFFGAFVVCPALKHLLYMAGVFERSAVDHSFDIELIAMWIMLLILGGALSLCGVWSVVHGFKLFRVRSS